MTKSASSIPPTESASYLTGPITPEEVREALIRNFDTPNVPTLNDIVHRRKQLRRRLARLKKSWPRTDTTDATTRRSALEARIQTVKRDLEILLAADLADLLMDSNVALKSDDGLPKHSEKSVATRVLEVQHLLVTVVNAIVDKHACQTMMWTESPGKQESANPPTEPATSPTGQGVVETTELMPEAMHKSVDDAETVIPVDDQPPGSEKSRAARLVRRSSYHIADVTIDEKPMSDGLYVDRAIYSSDKYRATHSSDRACYSSLRAIYVSKRSTHNPGTARNMASRTRRSRPAVARGSSTLKRQALQAAGPAVQKLA